MSFPDRLQTYISRSYLDGESGSFDLDTPLLELNIISSADIFDIVQFINSEAGVELPLDEISPENFRSVRAISIVVERLRRQDPVALSTSN
jgi:acyl carrier protein